MVILIPFGKTKIIMNFVPFVLSRISSYVKDDYPFLEILKMFAKPRFILRM